MKRPVVSLSLSLLACTFVVAAGSARAQNGPTDPYAGMEGGLFNGQSGFTLPYRLAKPPAYDAANKYPLVIFLHGSGESGTGLRAIICGAYDGEGALVWTAPTPLPLACP